MPKVAEKAKAELITRKQAAKLAGVQPDSISRIEARGLLKVVRIPGCHPMYDRQSVLDLLARSTIDPSQ